MTPAETIAAAIEKLEHLTALSTPGEWSYVDEPYGDLVSLQEPYLQVMTVVASELDESDGKLLLTLRATVDAQVALLRELHNIAVNAGWSEDEFPSKPGHAHGMALARAILGGES